MTATEATALDLIYVEFTPETEKQFAAYAAELANNDDRFTRDIVNYIPEGCPA